MRRGTGLTGRLQYLRASAELQRRLDAPAPRHAQRLPPRLGLSPRRPALLLLVLARLAGGVHLARQGPLSSARDRPSRSHPPSHRPRPARQQPASSPPSYRRSHSAAEQAASATSGSRVESRSRRARARVSLPSAAGVLRLPRVSRRSNSNVAKVVCSRFRGFARSSSRTARNDW